MGKLRAVLRRFAGEDGGATAIEYGLIAGLMAVTAIVGITLFGGSLSGLFNYVAGRSSNAMSGG